MQYAENRKKPPTVKIIATIARLSVLTSAAIALSATVAEAQSIGFVYGSPTYFGSAVCGGSIGWGPPGPVVPSLGGYYPSPYTLVYVNGQLMYSPPPNYTDPSCFNTNPPTGGNGPTIGGPSLDLFVSSNDGGDKDDKTNGDTETTNDWTDDGPNNPPGYPDTPINNLTVVTPEPSTIVLLASGLLGLGVVARRRRVRGQRPQDG